MGHSIAGECRTCRILARAGSVGMPMAISRSKRPALLKAGSRASGLLVAPADWTSSVNSPKPSHGTAQVLSELHVVCSQGATRVVGRHVPRRAPAESAGTVGLSQPDCRNKFTEVWDSWRCSLPKLSSYTQIKQGNACNGISNTGQSRCSSVWRCGRSGDRCILRSCYWDVPLKLALQYRKPARQCVQ